MTGSITSFASTVQCTSLISVYNTALDTIAVSHPIIALHLIHLSPATILAPHLAAPRTSSIAGVWRRRQADRRGRGGS